MVINGKTQIVGIFGFPVRHTFSPLMHNAAFQKRGLNVVYLPFCVKPDDLKKACESIKALGMVGVNITIPHKQKVMDFLDKIDSLAEMIGAVNTVYNDNGKLIGYNTDGQGFINSLTKEGKFVPLGKTAFLIGAGGAGHALAIMLAKEGIKKIFLCDIEIQKSKILHERIKKYFNECEVELVDFEKTRIADKISKADILLNTTPLGMKESDAAIVKKELLRKDMFVYDVVYNRKTALLNDADRIGARTLGGLGMLLNQGALAFKIWTGKDAPVEVMEDVLKSQIVNSK